MVAIYPTVPGYHPAIGHDHFRFFDRVIACPGPICDQLAALALHAQRTGPVIGAARLLEVDIEPAEQGIIDVAGKAMLPLWPNKSALIADRFFISFDYSREVKPVVIGSDA